MSAKKPELHFAHTGDVWSMDANTTKGIASRICPSDHLSICFPEKMRSKIIPTAAQIITDKITRNTDPLLLSGATHQTNTKPKTKPIVVAIPKLFNMKHLRTVWRLYTDGSYNLALSKDFSDIDCRTFPLMRKS
jgi:hypothetical protein